MCRLSVHKYSVVHGLYNEYNLLVIGSDVQKKKKIIVISGHVLSSPLVVTG